MREKGRGKGRHHSEKEGLDKRKIIYSTSFFKKKKKREASNSTNHLLYLDHVTKISTIKRKRKI